MNNHTLLQNTQVMKLGIFEHSLPSFSHSLALTERPLTWDRIFCSYLVSNARVFDPSCILREFSFLNISTSVLCSPSKLSSMGRWLKANELLRHNSPPDTKGGTLKHRKIANTSFVTFVLYTPQMMHSFLWDRFRYYVLKLWVQSQI